MAPISVACSRSSSLPVPTEIDSGTSCSGSRRFRARTVTLPRAVSCGVSLANEPEATTSAGALACAVASSCLWASSSSVKRSMSAWISAALRPSAECASAETDRASATATAVCEIRRAARIGEETCIVLLPGCLSEGDLQARLENRHPFPGGSTRTARLLVVCEYRDLGDSGVLDRRHDLGDCAVGHSLVGAQMERRLGNRGLDVARALLELPRRDQGIIKEHRTGRVDGDRDGLLLLGRCGLHGARQVDMNG